MKVGVVSVSRGEPKPGSGLEDTLRELERQKTDYEIIHPQEICWRDGEYCLYKEDEREFLSLSKETEDVDIFYIRSILGKGLSWYTNSYKRNLRMDGIASLGKPMVNEPEAMNRSKDKSWAYRSLYHTDFIPKTSFFSLLTEKDKDAIYEDVSRAFKGKRDVILKPVDGTGGGGCITLEAGTKYRPIVSVYPHENIIIQDRLEGEDYRFWYIGDEFMGAIERMPVEGDFRGNIADGSEAVTYNPSEDEIKMGKLVQEKHGLEVSALDLRRDLESEELKLLETNCFPGWKSFKSTFRRSLAPDIIKYLRYKYNLEQSER